MYAQLMGLPSGGAGGVVGGGPGVVGGVGGVGGHLEPEEFMMI